MSRGHGWIERELIALFDDRQHTGWTIAELCRAIYYPEQAAVPPSHHFGVPIVGVSVSKGQRVAVLRALRTSGADKLAWVSATLPKQSRLSRGAYHECRFQRRGTALRSSIWAWRYGEEGPIWTETEDNRVGEKFISLTIQGQRLKLRVRDLGPLRPYRPCPWHFVWTRSLLNGCKAMAEWEKWRRHEAYWRDLRERNSRVRLTGAEANNSPLLGG
jgi:hypothetical protein